VKDRWIAARTLYGQTVGDEARSPEEVASDYDLPLEAVLEAIAYCELNPPEIREDWEREESRITRKADSSRSNGDTRSPGSSSIPTSSPRS
jgi:hypothetical protein